MEGVLFCSDRWAVFPHPTLEGLGGLSSAPLNCWEPASGAPRWPALCTCARLGWWHRRAWKRQDSWAKPTLHNGRQRLKLWPPRASGPPPAASPSEDSEDDRDPGRWGSAVGLLSPCSRKLGGGFLQDPSHPVIHQIPWTWGRGRHKPWRVKLRSSSTVLNY